VNPEEAATWPTKSQRETPADESSLHCLCTCLAMVATRMIELAHPMRSVTVASPGRWL
jgi:hypothetical protein